MNIPAELLYSSEHEWVRVDGNVAYVGITDFAQNSLGDVVFVELPEVDSDVEIGADAATVESVKAVAPIYSPVAGKVVEVNSELEDAPEKLNEAPYDAFVFAVELSAPFEKGELLNADEYAKLCEEQE